MKNLTLGLLAICVATSPAVADPLQDAESIVEATILPETFEAAFEAIGGLMVGNIQNEVRQSGEEMSPEAAQLFSRLFMTASSHAMVEQMKEPMVEAYVANLSPQTLADYRAFLETPSGAEFIAAQPALMAEGARIGEAIGAQIALPALEIMKVQLAEGDVPPGTLKTVENELKNLLGVGGQAQPPL